MKRKLTMLFALLVSAAVWAQCPKVFVTEVKVEQASSFARITMTAPTGSVGLTAGSRIALIYRGGGLQSSRIVNLRTSVVDPELGLSRYVFKTRLPKFDQSQVVALLSEVGPQAKTMASLPHINPKVMQGPRQADADEFALDLDGDQSADLTFQKFCLNAKCASDYVLGELHVWQKNQRTWKFCVAQEPL